MPILGAFRLINLESFFAQVSDLLRVRILKEIYFNSISKVVAEVSVLFVWMKTREKNISVYVAFYYTTFISFEHNLNNFV